VLNQLRLHTENGERECHSRLADGCLRWRALEGRPREYSVRHLVAHLRQARRYDEAAAVLTDFEYLTERLCRPVSALAHQPSTVFEVLDDCQETLFAKDGAVADAALRGHLEDLYRLCCAHAHELNDDPTLLVPLAFNEFSWLWNKESARGKALWAAAERHPGPWLRSLVPRQESFDPHPMQKLPGHRGLVRAVAYSPDGELLVSVSHDRTARICDARTGQLLHEPFSHPDEVTSAVITEDGDTIITGCRDGIARLLNCDTGRLLREIAAGEAPIQAMALSPEGGLLAVGRAGGRVGVWILSENRWAWERHHHSGGVHCVTFSPDGERLATGGEDRRLIVWSAHTGEQLHEFIPHHDWVEAVVFSPNHRYLITGAGYKVGEIKLWDATTFQYLRMIPGHLQGVGAFAFSPSDRLFASGSCDTTIRVMDLETGALLLPPMASGGVVYGLAFSPDSGTLASAGSDGLVQLWRMPSGDQPTWQEISLGVDPAITAMAYSHDGRALLVACEDKTLRLRDSVNALPIGLISGFSECVTDIAVSSANGTVVCGAGCEIGIWNGQLSDKPRIFRGHGKGVSCVAISRDGTRIVSGGGEKLAMLWDAATPTWIRNFEGHAEVLSTVAFSPNAKTIASADGSGRLLVWAIEGTQPRVELIGHRSAVLAMSFSPDPEGALLATGDRDGGARLWNTQTGALVRAIFGHVSEITSVAFAPDGRFFATGSRDDLVRVWCVETGEQVAVLPCARAVGAVWFGGDNGMQPILHVADIGGATHIPGTYVVQLQNANRGGR
jgi:WD40 repeat protein